VSAILAVAFQISVSVQVADTIVARTQVPVTVRATASGNTAPNTTAPRADGTVFTRVSEQTRVGGGFGQAVATRETRYLVTATQSGSIVISPVVASLGVQRAISPARTIIVREPPRNAVPALVLRAPVARSREINFHALVTRDTVWAGEQVTVQVGVFIDDELRANLRRSPEYVASSVDGAASYDLPVANDALPSRDVEGARYRPFVFARALFPLLPGVLTIPPSRLNYVLGGAGTLFGQRERQTASTQPLRVVVRELPSSGRPASFTGAVGVYALSAALDRATVRSGDAIQLTVRIDGVGNIRYLPAPRVEFGGAVVTSAGESVAVDSSDLLVRGSKTLRYLITPETVGVLDLGAVRYAYFNPVVGAYQETVASLGTIRVLAGGVNAPKATTDGTASALPLAIWAPASAADVMERVWFRALLAVLLLPWFALLMRRMWFLSRGHTSFSRQRSAPSFNRPLGLDDGRSLRTRIVDTLAPIARLAPAAPIESSDLTRRLRKAGVTTEAAEAAAALIARLDRASFGTPGDSAELQIADLAGEWESLRAQILRERSPRYAGASAQMLLICFACGALALHAQPLSVLRADSAYRAGRFDRAAELFALAASDDPANASLWANLGAAQWMRADTAGALLAWQRSERLSPSGHPATSLLGQFVFTGTPATRIMPVSPDAIWMALLVVAAVLSLSAALWRWRGRRLPTVVLLGGTTAILVLAAGAVLAERSRDALGLVMLRRDVALRSEPVLAGEVVARSRAGEIAVVRDARGAWRLIAVSGRAPGWVEAAAIRSLALTDGRDVALMESRIASDDDAP
jgi:tetratricopeptide (TPR) repeat protein